MAQYPHLFIMSFFTSVPNLVLLSQNAQLLYIFLLAILLHYIIAMYLYIIYIYTNIATYILGTYYTDGIITATDTNYMCVICLVQLYS